ncbi:M20 metallopeptidase family protein [Oceanivirga salmonicida]|uniref:M20 metallopeptidase family protein n=1 Tax=Oceanivirga salmonicida TaxID=1769291 RepID=UPI000AF2FC95|nr:amidohydrolase [Oceanivirga salmonicida]
MDTLKEVKKIEDYIINTRRKIHQNPELSSNEFETQAFIMQELKKFGIESKKIGTSSVAASIFGNKAGKTVLLRADIDALPIIEQSNVEYKSKNEGKMHACGHDAHTSMLLAAAKILSENKHLFCGEVRLIFQEAEETFTGAKKVVKDGIMEGVDAAFGLHGMPIPVGSYNMSSGYKMAGCDTIYVNFEGVSGHGSSPHLAKDTIHPACVFVTELQNIVTKFVDSQDPLVLSVGKFVGGTKANIIAKYTKLEITMRYFNSEIRKRVHELIQKRAKSIELAYEIKVDVEIEESTISMYNDETITEIAQKSAEKVFGKNKNQPMEKLMGSEDMPYYFEKAKGAYALLGYYNEEIGAVYFPHSEKYKIDENCLKFGTALHVQFALDYLNQ